MPTTSSPLRYPGGKSQLTQFVIELMRTNDLFYGEYIEPFAGGAGVACRLLFDGYVSHIHINDLDRSIYAFWWAAINDTERLCKKIHDTKISVSQWRRQRRVQLAADPGLFDLGFSTFFLNRTNRSGIIDGGVIGGLGQGGNYPIDCRFNKVDLVRKIERLGAHRAQVSISNLDARAFLRRLGRRKSAPRGLVNIDPPYYVMGRELYKNWFREADHTRLAAMMGTIKPFWMVTYDDTPETRALYAKYPSYNQHLNYSAQVKRVGVELLVLDPRLQMPSAYAARAA